MIAISATGMSRKSETALLREELARLAVENQDLRRMMSKIETASGWRIATLEAENDRLRPEIAERDRGISKYENAHAPSSTRSMYNEKRAASRKIMTKGGYDDEDGDGDGPEPDGDGDRGNAGYGPSRRGPLAGHVGSSHNNKADRTVVLRVHRCGTCGRGHLRNCRRSSRWSVILPAVTP